MAYIIAYGEIMCGIIGYCGLKNAKDEVASGLKILEYRGYDSAGMALVSNSIRIFKTAGSVDLLTSKLPKIEAHTGIGHTRWATHGKPTAKNAHPHLSYDKKVAIVHNGIIENFAELKDELRSKGITLKSSTDSEVIAHLIALRLEDLKNQKDAMLTAVDEVGSRLKGTATFLAVQKGDGRIYARRKNASLCVGIGDSESYVASDAIALPTQKVATLNDDECAVLSNGSVNFYYHGRQIEKTYLRLPRTPLRHCPCHMRAEIDEIPSSLHATFSSIENGISPNLLDKIRHSNRIFFIGCGTAYHACLYAKRLFEQYVCACEAVEASEFSLPEAQKDILAFFISQSGETADVLCALNQCKSSGISTVAITNAPHSAAARTANFSLSLNAGAEIAVAATKSYCCQLLATLQIARMASGKPLIKTDLDQLCKAIENISRFDLFDERIKRSKPFFIGKGLDGVTAREGALKFKEITYKMTDAYFAGELKHGAIALIDKKSVAFTIATIADDKSRIEATIGELKSRGAYAISISSIGELGADKTLALPTLPVPELHPILSVIPLQNLALSTALSLGLNPDKPRNLAKSVTVI